MARQKLSDFEKKIRTEIASNLRKYSKNHTQAQLSEMTGIPQSTISGYFAERSTINPGNLQKLSDALNVKKSDIDPRFKSDYLEQPEKKEDSYYKLNEKEKNDIAIQADKLLEGIESGENLNFYGEPATEEQKERIRVALRTAMEMNKEEAKKKFTRKDYRK